MEDEIAPNAFVLSKGMLKLSEGALIGVIAHELTHLYLQKGENNFDNLYYFAYDELRHQGRVAPNLELSKKIGYYRTYMEIVGPFSAETLSGIPFDFRNMHESADDTLRYLLRSKVDAQECRPLIENYDKLYENLWLGVEMVDNRQELVNVDSFKDLVDKVEVELKTCFGNQKISLKELVIRSYDVSSSVYDWNLKLMPSEKLQIIKMAEKLFEQKSLTEALLELTRYARAEMRRFEAENNVSQIRYYSSEDHADEIALQVLYALDVPVEPFNDFFVNGLEGADEEVYVCNLEVEPFYGFLDDDHKNDCWRVYRNQRYYQWLKENNNNSDLGR